MRWYDLDAGFAVGEAYEGDCAGFVDDGLGFFGVGEAVRDGNMAVAFGVDTSHLAAEELTVGGGVLELVEGDEIMDHLMEDGVLDEGFGQVNADVDAEDEIFVAVATEKALFAASEGQFAEETFGVGKADGNSGKLPAEIAGIELVKAGLDIGDGGFHKNVSGVWGTFSGLSSDYIILIT